VITCSICKKPIEKNAIGWDQGNNAEPINSGRCCDECDSFYVIPARLKYMIPGISTESARAIGKLAHQPVPPELLEQINQQNKPENENKPDERTKGHSGSGN
jgi:hypothetical protein